MVGGYFLILAPGNLYNALVTEDWPMFRSVMIRFALIATAVLVLKILRGVLRECSSNLLRNRLTLQLHELYLGNDDFEDDFQSHRTTYYNLKSERLVDNPDQRLVADTREFSSSLFDILGGGGAQGPDTGGILEALFSVVFYSRATFVRTGWFGIVAAYVWSFLVAILSFFVINRTSPVLFTQERLEGDFRYAHAHVRRHVEQIAFWQGALFERMYVNMKLQRVVSNTWSVIIRHVWLNGLQYGFGYYISLVMYLTLMTAARAKVFNEGLGYPASSSPGERAQWVAQTGGIFIQLLYSFTMIVQLGTALSVFVANIARLTALLDALSNRFLPIHPEDSEPLIRKPGAHEFSGDCIVVDELSVPLDDRKCTQPVSFTLRKSDNIVVTGPTGSGKTSVLRAMRRLRQPESGCVSLPRGVIFAPQMPYMPFGRHSLRAVVVYPALVVGSQAELARVCRALQTVGLERLLPLVDCHRSWGNVLSTGERQLIAACRVLVAEPDFVVMDEPTSALDVPSEKRVIHALRSAGISTLIVAHSHTILSLNRRVICIRDDGQAS